MKLRRLADEELPGVCDLITSLEPWQRLQVSAANLVEASRRDRVRQIIVADCDAGIGGCIMYRTSFAYEFLFRLGFAEILRKNLGAGPTAEADDLPQAAYVNLLAVFPPMQGGGVGAALLTYAEAEAADGGANRIYLCVSERNPRAQAFYERQGYAQVGIAENCIRAGNTEHLMMKEL